MTSAVWDRTPNIKLGLLEFNFPNWADDANLNMKLIDSALGLSGVTIDGAWQNSTTYVLGMLIVDSDLNSLWRCAVPHTSAAVPTTFAQDRAAHPTYWTSADAVLVPRGAWTSATVYYPNDVVYKDANKYSWAMATKNYMSAASYDADVAAGNLTIITDQTQAVTDATAAKNAAQSSATAAAGSATSASTSATNAANSASAASTSATNAANSATSAQGYASQALTYSNNASTYATNAQNSATAAANSAAQALAIYNSMYPDAPSNGLTYGRKNGAWSTIVGGAVVSDTAPAGPLQSGQLWYESDSGNTFLWYDDGNSQQWVQQNVMPTITGLSNYYTKTEADARYVDVTGDTMTGSLSVTGSITASGNITATGRVIATGNNAFSGAGNYVILAPTTAGTIYLRPNGDASAVGQMTVNNAGDTSVGGALTTSDAITCNSGAITTANGNIIAGGAGNLYTQTATAGRPQLILQSIKAPPVGVGDAGIIQLQSRNSANVAISYGQMYVNINDSTAGNEDSTLVLSNMRAGTLTAGLQMTASGLSVVGTVTANNGSLVCSGNINAGTGTNNITVGQFSTTGATQGKNVGYNNIQSSVNTNAASYHVIFYNPSSAGNPVGAITTTNAGTAYATTSDERLKDFIGAYDPQEAIRIIRADPVRDFHWKENGLYAVGWGAQTSYAISEDLAVPPPEDYPDDTWGVDQGRRTPYLWAALTWALDKIDSLEARVAALESRL